MSSENNEIRMTDLVDEPPHFLIWQLDEIALFGLAFAVGIFAAEPLYGCIVGFFLKKEYMKIRDGKPRGYFMHRLRELGLGVASKKGNSSMQPPLVDRFHQ